MSRPTAGTLAKAAHGAGAAAIGGKVFAYGGSVGTTAFSDIQQFDPATRRSTLAGKLPQARTEFTAVTDPTAPMTYLVGGWDGRQPTDEVLSTLDGTTFQPVASLPEPVIDPAVVLAGDTIWVFGGTWNNVASSSIQKIDVKAGNAQVVGKMAAPITNAMAFAIDGVVFLAGGKVNGTRSADVSRFDPSTSTADADREAADAALGLHGGGPGSDRVPVRRSRTERDEPDRDVDRRLIEVPPSTTQGRR